MHELIYLTKKINNLTKPWKIKTYIGVAVLERYNMLPHCPQLTNDYNLR